MGDLQGHPFRGNQWTEGGPALSRGDFKTTLDGSAPTSDDNPTGSFSTFGQGELRATESSLQGRSTETAQVLDAQGRSLLLRTSGAASYVQFAKEDLDKMRGGVLTHNHPNSGPLSDDDVYLTMKRGLREMRAVTKDGVLYRLGSTSGWTEQMLSTYSALRDDSMNDTRRRVGVGEITADQANNDFPNEAHAYLLKFAKAYAHMGVYYKRTRRK